MNAVEKVLAAAPELSPEERSELAQLLLAVAEAPDPDWYASIAPEVERRSARIKSGEAKTTPWSEVRKMMFERAHGIRD